MANNLDLGSESISLSDVVPLHLIAGSQSPYAYLMAKALLERGADPNARDSLGVTPIHVAASWGNYETLKLLLLNGGNPDVKDEDGKSPLELARQEDRHECAQLLAWWLENSKFDSSKKATPVSNRHGHRRAILQDDSPRISDYAASPRLDFASPRRLEFVSPSPSSTTTSSYKPKYFTSPLQSPRSPNGRRPMTPKNTSSTIARSTVADFSSERHPVETGEKSTTVLSSTSHRRFIDFDQSQQPTAVEESRENSFLNRRFIGSFNLDRSNRAVSTSITDSAVDLFDGSCLAKPTRSPVVELKFERLPETPPCHQHLEEKPSSTTERNVSLVEINKSSTRTPTSSLIGARKSDFDNKEASKVRRSLNKSAANDQNEQKSVTAVALGDSEQSKSRPSSRLSQLDQILFTTARMDRLSLLDDGLNAFSDQLNRTLHLDSSTQREALAALEATILEEEREIDPRRLSECNKLSDADLRRRAINQGMDVGPITPGTRFLYVRRLAALLSDGATTTAAVTAGGQKRYLTELQAAIDGRLNSAECRQDEASLRVSFDSPSNGAARQWREGCLKMSFCYLLLDPTITRDLPTRAVGMSESDSFKLFVDAIFYVGKGKKTRPQQHLVEAACLGGDSVTKSAKINRILSLWKQGYGVVSLHVFQNTIPAEAYTREAAMIDTIGLDRLCNVKRGDYYGAAANWTVGRRRRLGAHLLKLAYSIFLAEGEKQLKRDDVLKST